MNARLKVLVFEWLYGGGLWFDGLLPDPDCAIQRQGWRMLDCLTCDLKAIGVAVYTLKDARCNRSVSNCRIQRDVSQQRHVAQFLQEIAEVVDFIILIAPECNGCLLRCCQWLDGWAHKIISPDSQFVQLTSDKNKTAKWLSASGVSVANEFDPASVKKNASRFVIKPALGAGSEQVGFADDAAIAGALNEPDKWRIEEYIEGITVSVSVLSGCSDTTFLRPTRQILNGEFGAYQSSEPIDCNITRERALTLAENTIQALPSTRGYVGIDMVIGKRACVVDVNPRLTSSYCYLRKLENFNIAERMIRNAIGARTEVNR